MRETFKHTITSVESKNQYIVKEPTNKNSQSSYQLGKKAGECFLKENVLEKYGNATDTMQDYKLKDGYAIKLSSEVKDIVGKDKIPQNPDIIFTYKINNGKFDIRRKVNLEEGNQWFVDFFDYNTKDDSISVTLDTRQKVVEFDIETKYPRVTNFTDFNFPKQQIFFGAPGTGKSYSLNEEASIFNRKNIKRVTFHPSLLYNDFVGGFKPFPTNDPNVPIDYRYIPGSLIRILVESILNPYANYLLIIEEINRANVSSVFGEMFQLLDRNYFGRSQYPIDISMDLQLYLNERIYNNNALSTERRKEIDNLLEYGLVFPENFFIWATMNSADQGVLPLDTAFKRRWSFKYFTIDNAYEEDIFNNFCSINLPNNKKVSWNDIRVFINNLLSRLNVPEDKLLGPYFISKSILQSSNEKLTEEFKNKVLMYLFEDIGIHFRNKIFDIELLRYSEILKQFDIIGEKIFTSNELLEDKILKNTSEESSFS